MGDTAASQLCTKKFYYLFLERAWVTFKKEVDSICEDLLCNGNYTSVRRDEDIAFSLKITDVFKEISGSSRYQLELILCISFIIFFLSKLQYLKNSWLSKLIELLLSIFFINFQLPSLALCWSRCCLLCLKTESFTRTLFEFWETFSIHLSHQNSK